MEFLALVLNIQKINLIIFEVQLSKCHLLETQTKDYITTHDIVIEGSKFCYGGYTMNYNKLNPQEERVIVDKATEPPFSGEYDNFYEDGTFICRRCNAPLFSSKSKFDAGCGWPSFDENLPNAIKRIPDPDGTRTEIECTNCGAHLGHEFLGEHLTNKNTRECVNSLSIRFFPKGKELPKTIIE